MVVYQCLSSRAANRESNAGAEDGVFRVVILLFKPEGFSDSPRRPAGTPMDENSSTSRGVRHTPRTC